MAENLVENTGKRKRSSEEGEQTRKKVEIKKDPMEFTFGKVAITNFSEEAAQQGQRASVITSVASKNRWKEPVLPPKLDQKVQTYLIEKHGPRRNNSCTPLQNALVLNGQEEIVETKNDK